MLTELQGQKTECHTNASFGIDVAILISKHHLKHSTLLATFNFFHTHIHTALYPLHLSALSTLRSCTVFKNAHLNYSEETHA